MAIAFVRTAQNRDGTAGSTLAVNMTVTAGDCVVVLIDYDNGAVLPSSVTDNAGNAYALRASKLNNHLVTIWSTAANGTLAATSITATFPTTGVVLRSMIAADYSGVASLGLSAGTSGTSVSPSVSIVTQDPNNFVVAGMHSNSALSTTMASGTGNLRATIQAGAGSNCDGYVDNTGAGTGSITCSVSIPGSVTWAAVAIELRSTFTPIPPLLTLLPGVNSNTLLRM